MSEKERKNTSECCLKRKKPKVQSELTQWRSDKVLVVFPVKEKFFIRSKSGSQFPTVTMFMDTPKLQPISKSKPKPSENVPSNSSSSSSGSSVNSTNNSNNNNSGGSGGGPNNTSRNNNNTTGSGNNKNPFVSSMPTATTDNNSRANGGSGGSAGGGE